jgi:hypothetical protein
MRIRALKPEFFLHEGIAALSIEARLFYSGLWCCADREGRFEWRVRRLKAQIFPYDDFNVEKILEDLLVGGFIHHYFVNDAAYGYIDSWARHQIPARDEPPSEIPAPDGSITVYTRPPNQTIRARLYQRDDYRCSYCGRDMTADNRARCLDHVIPYSHGGTNNEKNLVTSCKKCNAAKADRDPAEAGMAWPVGLGERYKTDPPLTVSGHPVNVGLEVADLLLEKGIGDGPVGDGSGGLAPSSALALKAPLLCRVSDFQELWNATTKPPIPRCRDLTGDRRRKVQARLVKRPSLAEWQAVFEAIQANSFYLGQNDRGWIADFDYVIKNDTISAKILERAQTPVAPTLNLGKQSTRALSALDQLSDTRDD